MLEVIGAPEGRIGNEVKIFSGPATVGRSQSQDTTGFPGRCERRRCQARRPAYKL